MENDIGSINNENLVDIKDYFQLDFAEQTIQGNRKFEEFKKQRLNEFGKDAKLFHCKNDNIIFYVSKKACKIDDGHNDYYFKQCPLCKNYICYFCKRIRNYPIGVGRCCALSHLYYIFFIKGFQYCKNHSKLDNKSKRYFKIRLILDLIPLTKCFCYYIFFF